MVFMFRLDYVEVKFCILHIRGFENSSIPFCILTICDIFKYVAFVLF